MTISILQKLTIAKLTKIANDNNVDISLAKKKDDYISSLRKALPADFNFEPYLKNDFQKKDSTLGLLNSSQSLSDFVPTIKNMNNENNKRNENMYDDTISALFDVTNYEPKKLESTKNNIVPPLDDSLFNKPTRKNAPYRPRFGPAPTSLKSQENKISPSDSLPLQGFSNKQIQNKQKQGLPLYRQAYTSPPRNESFRSSFYKNESAPTFSYNKRPAVPTSTNFHDTNEQMPLPLDKEIIEDIVLNDVNGYLEIFPNGYGFLREASFNTSSTDVYVSSGIIEKYLLKNGDFIVGKSSNQKEGMKYSALLYVEKINNFATTLNFERADFENLTPIYPDKKILLENKNSTSLSIRMIDFLLPVGFGQRGLLVSYPRSGASTLLLDFANSVLLNNKSVNVLYILVDCEPEMVTEIKEKTKAEVFYSTFEKTQENTIKVTELVFERAKRLVEDKKDVVILLDSINKLAKAYQVINNKKNNSLIATINNIKQLYSLARNVREGGSLTIICNFENESNLDINKILYEELLDKSNAVLELDSTLSKKYFFPAINIKNSFVKKPELFLSKKDIETFREIRSNLSNIENIKIVEQLIELIINTKDNNNLRSKLPDWLSLVK